MEQIPMTIEGERKLRQQLDEFLKRRPKITQAIAEARELGDLKENAEYHAAREEQGLCEAQIREIEYKLSVALVIDVTKSVNTGKVIFGSTVTLLDINTDEKVTYTIVGEDESDIKARKISVTSPVARGLIGKQKGDEVMITTPGGEKDYDILDVQYI